VHPLVSSIIVAVREHRLVGFMLCRSTGVEGLLDVLELRVRHTGWLWRVASGLWWWASRMRTIESRRLDCSIELVLGNGVCVIVPFHLRWVIAAPGHKSDCHTS